MELHTFEKTIGSDGDFGGNLHSNDSGEEELFVKKKKKPAVIFLWIGVIFNSCIIQDCVS